MKNKNNLHQFFKSSGFKCRRDEKKEILPDKNEGIFGMLGIISSGLACNETYFINRSNYILVNLWDVLSYISVFFWIITFFR